MVAGTPSLRGPDGERALREGDVVCFPAGPAGAHQVIGPGTVLMLAANAPFDTIEYPDSGKIMCARPGRSSEPPTPSATGTASERAAQPLRRRRRGRSRRSRPATAAACAEFGQSIGATQLGGSLYELDPGDSISPYHYECVEEEWLLVLVGTPRCATPTASTSSSAATSSASRPSPQGAHKVTNRSESLARVLMFATRPSPDISICVYPDSDKVGVWPRAAATG